MIEVEDEIGKYKKKSIKPKSSKSTHKHVYIDCVFEYDNPHGKLENRGFIHKKEFYPGTYCQVCGKIGSMQLFFWEVVEKPETPVFTIYDIFDKYVNLDEERFYTMKKRSRDK